MEITLEEIQKKFESLPEDLKWAIMGANVDDNIIDIGQKENLTVEQMGQLSLETHMVMFGFTPPKKFEESVKGSMQLPDDKTRAIVDAINEKILKEIRKKMLENSATDTEKETDETDESEIGIPVSSSLPIVGLPHGEKPAAEEIVEDREEILRKIQEPTPTTQTPSMLAQKLSVPVQNQPVKTEHTLDNITKTSSITYPKNEDPYRMKPE